MTVAVTALIRRKDGKLLVVWNKRLGCWTLPGGKVEEGEDFRDALYREIYEEVGLVRSTVLSHKSTCARLFYEAPGALSDGWRVLVYEVAFLEPVTWGGWPSATEREQGCPVTWWTREEFLKWCRWPEWYTRMFAALDEEKVR